VQNAEIKNGVFDIPSKTKPCLMRALGLYCILAATLAAAPRFLVMGEAYGQGLWYSGKIGYSFHPKVWLTTGYTYLEVPASTLAGSAAHFHIIPTALSGFWQLPFTSWPVHAEFLFGGNLNIGSDRIDRTGVRATMAGQNFTPLIGWGFAYLPAETGLVVRFSCYMFQGIDSQGLESRRLPWLGGSLGFIF